MSAARRIPRLMFVAGETSGDHHAAAVLRAIGARAECFGLGGEAMRKAGMRLDLDMMGRSVVGLVEVVRHLGFYRRALGLAEGLLRRERPDLLVLVDYPGFNLRLARRAHGLGVPVAYYISPQVWAWRRGRVPLMARVLRKMLVTFPFEKPIYDRAGLDCSLVGNPLLDAIPPGLLHRSAGEPPAARQARLRRALGWKGRGPWVGLLPGSREQEVTGLLPVMLASARALARPGAVWVVLKAPGAPRGWYEALARARESGLDLRLFEARDQAQAYRARAALDAALVASGTATLETALLGTPFCILYKVHPLTYAIGKRLVDIHSIGLANVVAGRRVVPEFLQQDLEPRRIAAELERLLDDPKARRAQRQALGPGLRSLGRPGVARRVAGELLALARERHGD